MSSAAPTNNEASRANNTSSPQTQIRKRSRSPSGASLGTVQKRQNLETAQDTKPVLDHHQTELNVGMTSAAPAAGPGPSESSFNRGCLTVGSIYHSALQDPNQGLAKPRQDTDRPTDY
ncbi:uncharacterized protein PGTG_10801 [Puccinia graminis f. sp. tritici CRL 75-36-700-3]|uniref:Uncharacterized protein n=1 Tax=Puccinia graminis f. sp. tritici (strain CRL 75-36-700-3 / race SCCL) TaxID=418459 RepID=E3KK17_PUCGT|nr:uncharacterized protein PGTG_10801 [Puccinia graminis f. sp. tritici CRL 75-36-700-3]EFP84642.1 hypothetical protein PGTG_10801 [Puccinia graminis f. sp. tritici CRL 75-36-700-3]